MKAQTKEIKLVEWFDDHWYKVAYDIGPDNKPIYDYIPSVSTKLSASPKPFLAKWRGDVGNREADLRMFEAAQSGTRIHHGWQTLTTGGTVIFNPWQKPLYSNAEIEEITKSNNGNVAVMAYQDEHYDLVKLAEWCNRVRPRYLASEMIVYDLDRKDAGTTDNVLWIPGGKYEINGAKGLLLPEGWYIADLKTGNTVDDDAFMQLSAYWKCVIWMIVHGFYILPEGSGEFMGALVIHTGAKTKTAIEGLSTLYRSPEELETDYSDYRAVSQVWERKNANARPKSFEFPAVLKLAMEG